MMNCIKHVVMKIKRADFLQLALCHHNSKDDSAQYGCPVSRETIFHANMV